MFLGAAINISANQLLDLFLSCQGQGGEMQAFVAANTFQHWEGEEAPKII